MPRKHNALVDLVVGASMVYAGWYVYKRFLSRPSNGNGSTYTPPAGLDELHLNPADIQYTSGMGFVSVDSLA